MTHSRVLFVLCAVSSLVASADPPSVFYIFPAGGQRGTTVEVRIGGHYLYDQTAWEMNGPGIKSGAEIIRTKRIWFEGPLIKQPASQASESYPQDYLGQVQITPDAPLGGRTWQAWNAQGVTPGLRFVVGNLPEVIEQETDGQPIPTSVSLPVTINGRVFPREDVDVWTFDATAGQTITCSVEAATLGLLNDPQLPRLEAQIEVRDPQGRPVAGAMNMLRNDPELRFTAAEAGVYQVRIWDNKFSGLQHYVYRLTVTGGPWISAIFPLGGKRGTESEIDIIGQGVPGNRLKVRWPESGGIVSHAFTHAGQPLNQILCDVDDLPEVIEPSMGELPALPTPGIANGRIEQPADIDGWKFAATKGTSLKIDIRAARLGSPLDAMLVVKDNTGKELAQADDLPGGSPDCELLFTAPADGEYTAEVRDRFASRGGSAFAYRLRIAPPEASDFTLTFTSDAIAVPIGGEQKLPINVERRGGFNAPVKLSVQGLPPGVTAADVEVPANQPKGEIVIKAAKDAAVQSARLAVIGVGGPGESPLTRKATMSALPGEPPAENIRLACTLPTPFKFKSQYEFRYVARGSTLKKHYLIERNGYEGPLEVSLADRQGRHLQGVSGPVVTIPAGMSEFDYTVNLPPWMELGRTSRSNLMLVGEVADAAGKKHKVSFVTNEQNEQLIALVTASPLRLSLDKSVLACRANNQLSVPVHLHRQVGMTGPCRLELVVPEHMRDIAAASVDVAAGSDEATLKIDLGPQPGPLNMPLLVRGQMVQNGEPVVAEVNLELLLKAN